MFKSLRYLLIPFSVIYGCIIKVRNLLFDKKIFRSATFDFPLICVGNLAVGGTGKTPMVEYIVRLLEKKNKIATLSRGYKRKTKGFFIANETSTSEDIGDEPMQIHLKFPDVTVAVAEERVTGIPQLLFERPATKIIILDDAFQHREVNAGLNILLTDAGKLYSNNLLLPAGNLRDNRSSSHRADMIIVTKCEPDLNESGKQIIIEQLNPLDRQKIYFATIEYGQPFHLFIKKNYELDANCSILLVTGIANPKPIEDWITKVGSTYQLLKFRDHHNFSLENIKEIETRFSKIENEKKIILTTEKDSVKLLKFNKELEYFPVYVLPMAHRFLLGGEAEFEKEILAFVNSFEEEIDQ
ncbi:MAG TPA: tetraacyldisaccharide 4'-kinase [Hanamia sp.]